MKKRTYPIVRLIFIAASLPLSNLALGQALVAKIDGKPVSACRQSVVDGTFQCNEATYSSASGRWCKRFGLPQFNTEYTLNTHADYVQAYRLELVNNGGQITHEFVLSKTKTTFASISCNDL